MGIPFYYSYLMKKHANILQRFIGDQQKNNAQKNYLFLDCNSIIYDACKETSDETKIIELVHLKIQEYIKMFSSQFTMIAFDGVPPYAKIKQQRNRRYKSFATKQILQRSSAWNTCAITPGTQFMKNLAEFLNKHYNNPRKYLLSTSHEPGEGEHKIFQYIRSNSHALLESNCKIIIYGLDADLIMLSLYHLRFVHNIYLFRETPHFIQQINSNLNSNEQYLINVDKLNDAIRFNNIDNYLILSFLLGNDFMPHFPTLNIRKKGMETLLNFFAEINKDLVTNSDTEPINWNNLRLLIRELADEELANFKNVYFDAQSASNKSHKSHKSHNPHKHSDNKFTSNKHQNTEDKEHTLNCLPQVHRDIELKINPNNSDWRFYYYKYLFDVNIEEDNNVIQKICINFLQGIEWTYKYYTGKPIDNMWCYKYDYPPLFADLIGFIPFYNTELTSARPNIFNEKMLLCYVMPKDSLHLIPQIVLNKLNIDDYPDDCEILWAYCKYFWEAHAILPTLNLSHLSEITQ